MKREGLYEIYQMYMPVVKGFVKIRDGMKYLRSSNNHISIAQGCKMQLSIHPIASVVYIFQESHGLHLVLLVS